MAMTDEEYAQSLREASRRYRERDPERRRRQMREAAARFRKKHPDQVGDGMRRANSAVKAIILLAKAKGCADCGQKDSRVLEFDHVQGEKLGHVSRIRYSQKAVLAEIEKCEVVCSNCHAIRTWERSRQGAKSA